MKTTLFIVSLLLSLSVMSQTKHALVIAIGDYPDNPAKFQTWHDLSSIRDVELVSSMLNEQKFPQENRIILFDEAATHDGILEGFDQLLKKVKKGDVVYFHYSGHGQQIMDIDGDEEDGWDESLVAYNAPIKWYDGYDGGEHLCDDEMRVFIAGLRKKLGKDGQIIIVLDSCHSGTGTRGGNETANARGTDEPCAPEDYKPKGVLSMQATDNDIDLSSGNDLSNVTTYSGCTANQFNYEFKDLVSNKTYGSLSFFFTTAVRELGENASYRNLFSKVQEGMMLQLNNKQQPVMESDNKDELVFSGDLIEAKPFFELTELGNHTASISGGSIHGLQKGDTIGFFNNDVIDFIKEDALFSGVITTINGIDADVDLLTKREGYSGQRVKFRASLTGAGKAPAKVRLKLDLTSKKANKEMKSYFASSEAIEVVENNYDYILRGAEGSKTQGQLIIAGNDLALRNMSPIELDESGKDKVKEALLNALRVKHFLGISLDDPNIDVQLEKDLNGIFKDGDTFKMIIKNSKSERAHFNYVSVSPGQRFYMGEWETLNASAEKILVVTFSCGSDKEPCGRHQLMIISSKEPLESLNNILEMGSSLGTRSGDLDEFTSFFESSMEGTRGPSFTVTNPKVDVHNYFYELKP